MPNSQILQVARPEFFLATQTLQSQPRRVAALAGTINWLAGTGGGPQLYQMFDGAAFQYTGALVTACRWYVPTRSTSHTVLDVEVECSLDVGNAQLTVRSGLAAGVVGPIVVPVGGPTRIALSGLTIASPYDEVTLEVVTGGGGTITVHRVTGTLQTLADPLPPQLAGGVPPIGVSSCGDDYPHTAGLNRQLRASISPLLDRVRSVWTWSALDPTVGQSTLRTGLLHRKVFRVWPGDLAAGIVFDAWVYAHNPTASSQYVYWQIGDPLGWLNQANPVEIPAFSTGWKNTTLRVPELMSLPGFPRETCQVGIYSDPINGGFGVSTASEIRAISVWGP